MNRTHQTCDVAVIGAGIVGISTAYYLAQLKPASRIMLFDAGQPMALTSAQSGENYRNWWPHPAMTAFTDHSISLMEAIAQTSNNVINMKRRGYVLVTRSNDVNQLNNDLISGYAELPDNQIRIHESASYSRYQPSTSDNWEAAPSGVDVITDPELIKSYFPYYDPSLQNLIHIRRAGDISSQQLGQYMLESFKRAGGIRITGKVQSIDAASSFQIQIEGNSKPIHAGKIVNAAGPFINDIAAMLNTQLPVHNTLQQKISFEDKHSTIARNMPFSIDLDAQDIAWGAEERELINADPDLSWLTSTMPGSIHCRPDGGDQGNRVKLGWAFNNDKASPEISPELLSAFPEIVLRGAARLNPALEVYLERLPDKMVHYGGYYTMTDENWPLIGPMNPPGTYVVGAMSGFGTMAACASGELCARWVLGAPLPSFANALSLQRHTDSTLMSEIHALSSRGVL